MFTLIAIGMGAAFLLSLAALFAPEVFPASMRGHSGVVAAYFESADITLLKGDLNGILKARNLSIETMKNIRQNLFFAFIYNVVCVPIAAGVLIPVLGILLSPMIASAAMTFSSVSVILNALRLRNLKL